GRLHVVVLDADERPLPGARLAHDERGFATDAQHARLGPRGPQPLRAPCGGHVERAVPAGLAGDRAELAELGDEALAVLVEVAVEGIQDSRVCRGRALCRLAAA